MPPLGVVILLMLAAALAVFGTLCTIEGAMTRDDRWSIGGLWMVIAGLVAGVIAMFFSR